jgi:hypothetical protein
MEKEFCCIMRNDNNDSDDDVDIIDVPLVEGDGDGDGDDDDESMGGLEVVRLPEGEKGEKGEKCEKEIDNSKLVQSGIEKMIETEPQSKPKGLEIELLITTTTCDEVIFKKHVVDIITRGRGGCVMMSGVVERYEFEGRVWDPDIVLVFEDGRRFYNENFGYMFRYYL